MMNETDTIIQHSLTDTSKNVILCILFSQMVLSIILNILSIVSICFAKIISPLNLLILNLALSDILYALNIPIVARQFYDHQDPYTLFTCRLNYLIDFISMSVNVYTIVALTLERFFMLKNGQKTDTFSIRYKSFIVTICLVVLWILAFLFSLPKALSIKMYNEYCGSSWSSKIDKIHFILTFIIFYALPSIVIFISSICILIFLRNWAKKSNSLRKQSNTQTESRVTMIKKRTTRFVLAIVFSFLCTWSPLWILHLFDQFSNKTSTKHIMIINSVVLMLNYLSGVANPIFFMLLTNNFRENFRILVQKIVRLRSSGSKKLQNQQYIMVKGIRNEKL